MKKNEHLVWWGAFGGLIAVYGLCYHFGVAVYALPVLMGLGLLFLFERGERGAFPFRKRHMVEYQFNYFSFVILLGIIFNATPRVLPSGEPAVQPLYWAVPMIGLYLFGLYKRRTA